MDAALADPGLDYFCTGPVWETPTKPGRAAVGLELPRYAAEHAGDTPFFAIGGVDAARLPAVLGTGASRIVVVRAVTSRVALLVIAAMSEPAFGSDQPWAHMSALAAMRGRKRFFCASVPNSIRVGPSNNWPF